MSARSVFGVYRAVASPELLAHVERTFVESAPAERQAAVRAEALRELVGAELVLSEDGTLISRAHGQEFLRVTLAPAVLEQSSFSFEKPSGQRLRIERTDPDTLVAIHEDKPPITFRRV